MLLLVRCSVGRFTPVAQDIPQALVERDRRPPAGALVNAGGIAHDVWYLLAPQPFRLHSRQANRTAPCFGGESDAVIPRRRSISKQRIRTVLLGAMALSLALPAAIRADDSPGPDQERARLLRARAEALFDQPNEWRHAARLLQASAELRTPDDPEAYDCLLYAGRIRATMGDFDTAAGLLGKAAEHALARGAVTDAAQAYVDAAFSARGAMNGTAAAQLPEQAQLLTGSPMLSAQRKGMLLARID